MNPQITVHTDGSFHDGVAACAFTVDVDGKEMFRECLAGDGIVPDHVSLLGCYEAGEHAAYWEAGGPIQHRNILGECMGVVLALRALAWLRKESPLDEKEGKLYVTLVFDYQGLDKWALGEWKRKNPLTRWYKEQVALAIKEANLQIEWQWTKGHVGVAGNEAVDKLAYKALQAELSKRKESKVTVDPKMETMCFTGHRPAEFGGYDEALPAIVRVKTKIEKAILSGVTKGGIKNIIVGGALGVDTWAAEAAMKLREEGNPLRIILAAPCKGQDSKWPFESKARYQSMLLFADEVHYLAEHYTPQCMILRDKWMVDHSHFVCAVWRHTKRAGGTWHTVKYAADCDRKILHIDPDAEFSMGWMEDRKVEFIKRLG